MVHFSMRFLKAGRKTVDLVSDEELKTSASIYLLVDEDIGAKSNRETDLGHFIAPELGPTTKFTYASHKAVSEYKEAKAVFQFLALVLDISHMPCLWTCSLCFSTSLSFCVHEDLPVSCFPLLVAGAYFSCVLWCKVVKKEKGFFPEINSYSLAESQV